MPATRLPHQIVIKIYSSDNNLLDGATVKLELGSASKEYTSKNGECILNVADISTWNVGDEVTITSSKTGEGTKITTLVLTSSQQKINIYLAETSDLIYSEQTETDTYNLNFSLLTTFDGEKVTSLNPLPVYSGKPKGFANAEKVIAWDASNNPVSITVTIGDKTYVKTITWDASNNPTNVTGWIEQ